MTRTRVSAKRHQLSALQGEATSLCLSTDYISAEGC